MQKFRQNASSLNGNKFKDYAISRMNCIESAAAADTFANMILFINCFISPMMHLFGCLFFLKFGFECITDFVVTV